MTTITIDRNLVAETYAHKMALDLECVLADYSGTWYDTAMKTLGEYRSAMNAIHERECPTFNPSWHYERLDRLLSMTLSDESYADYLYSLNIVAAAPSQPMQPCEACPNRNAQGLK